MIMRNAITWGVAAVLAAAVTAPVAAAQAAAATGEVGAVKGAVDAFARLHGLHIAVTYAGTDPIYGTTGTIENTQKWV